MSDVKKTAAADNNIGLLALPHYGYCSPVRQSSEERMNDWCNLAKTYPAGPYLNSRVAPAPKFRKFLDSVVLNQPSGLIVLDVIVKLWPEEKGYFASPSLQLSFKCARAHY